MRTGWSREQLWGGGETAAAAVTPRAQCDERGPVDGAA